MSITVQIIISLINEKGIREKDFLNDLGFNRTLLSDWKSGKSKSYNKHINKIAEYFDVSTDYLLGNTDIKKNAPTLEDEQMQQIIEGYTKLSKEDRAKAVDYLNLLLKNQESE